MSAVNIVFAAPVLSIVALATTTDLLHRRIPNGLSLGGAAVGLLINSIEYGPGGFALALLGWAMCLACFIPLYISGGMAGGDVKLIAMVGAFLGPVDGFVACLCTLIAGAALGALCVAWRRVARRFAPARQWAASHVDQEPSSAPALEHRLDKIPYAAAIALGATVAVLQPLWLMEFLPEVLP